MSRTQLVKAFCVTLTILWIASAAPQYNVTVIGGGMAGVTTANLLAKAGYTVAIIEANDYIGGRLKTKNVTLISGDFKFDEGASWIHGYSNSNPLKSIANKIENVKMIKT